MSSLTGQPIYQYYGDLLTTTNLGQGLSVTLEPLQDGLGNSSPIQIALNAVNFTRTGGNTFQLDSVDLTASATYINSVAQLNPVLPGTGAVTVPMGTTAQRPVSPVNGDIRYNTSLNALEAYQNNVWVSIAAGSVIGPLSSVAGDLSIFADTTGKVLADSGINISQIPPPLSSIRNTTLLQDIQLSGVDIINFGSSISNDVGVIYRQTDYVLGIFPNTIINKFPNIVLGFANPSSTDSAFELTEGAFLLSRLNQTQINALVAIDGMSVYNTTTEAFNFYQNGTWVDLSTGAVLSITGTTNEIVTTGSSSVTISLANNPVLPGTASVLVPFGSTAQRPGTPFNGDFRYNTDNNTFEGYAGGVWNSFSTGAVTSISGTTNEIVTSGSSAVTISLSNNPVLPGTASVLIPFGSTAQRPGTPFNGDFRYNTDSNVFEGYAGGSWLNFSTGGGTVTSITAGANLTGGTITSSGTIALNTTVTGLTSLDSNNLLSLDMSILATGGVPGFLNFYNAANSHFVSFTAPAAITSNVTWTLPATDGTAGYALTTNGAGTLSWAAGGNTTATYILQTPDATLPNSQALSLLGGPAILKVNGSGVVQAAIPDTDYATEAAVLIQVGLAQGYAMSAATSATAAATSAGAALASAAAAAASAVVASMAEGAITGATSATFILQVSNSNLPNAQVLGSLATGLLKNTTTTGVLTTATAGTDYYAPGFPTTIRDSGSATFNLFVGTSSGNGSVSGSFNSGFGDLSLTDLTSGNNNFGGGYNSLHQITSSSNNTGIGYNAGSSQTSYTECTFVGSGADASVGSLTNSTAIGYNASVAASNSLILGNAANVGIGTSTPNSLLHVVGGITLNRTPVSVGSGGTYTALVTDYYIGVTAINSGGMYVSLPAPTAANTGQTFIIKDEAGHAGVSTPMHLIVSGGALIDGAATQTTVTAYTSFGVYCNGTNYNLW